MFYRLLTMNKGNLIYILSYRLFQTSPKFRTPGGGVIFERVREPR